MMTSRLAYSAESPAVADNASAICGFVVVNKSRSIADHAYRYRGPVDWVTTLPVVDGTQRDPEATRNAAVDITAGLAYDPDTRSHAPHEHAGNPHVTTTTAWGADNGHHVADVLAGKHVTVSGWTSPTRPERSTQ